MKFSIIIPIFNAEHYLAKCLNSIVTQAYQDYELILLDDGSTDHSPAICKEYAVRYPQVRVVSQPNSGPAIARNNGIAKASGEYILFVDSDDEVSSDYFEVLDRVLSVSACNMVFFGCKHVIETQSFTKAFPECRLSGKEKIISFIAENLLRGDLASCWNKVFSRKLIEKHTITFPPNTVVDEDLIFVLKSIDNASDIMFIDDVLYYYNQQAIGSVTKKYDRNKFECKRNAYLTEISIVQKWKDAVILDWIHNKYLSGMSACINNMTYDACQMTYQEKIQEIRRFYSNTASAFCLNNCRDKSSRSRFMAILIELRLHRISYFIHWLVFKAKWGNR